MRNTAHPLIAVSALLLAAAFGSAPPATGSTPQAPAADPAAPGLPFQQAVAEAVRGAFDSRGVEVELSDVDVVSSNASQRELVARGRLALDGSDWIPLEVSALYDVATSTASAQRVFLGDSAILPSTVAAPLADRLSEEAARRLRNEFAGQSASVELAGIQARPLGSGLVAISAVGRTDFAGEGTAATSVHALYDRANNRWLRLKYQLGGDGMTEPVAGL